MPPRYGNTGGQKFARRFAGVRCGRGNENNSNDGDGRNSKGFNNDNDDDKDGITMYDEYLQLAIEAAQKAGDYLFKRKNIHVDAEYRRDIKLSSDKDSEKIIIDCLLSSELPVLSEELGLIEGLGDKSGENSDKLRWIVDPIDGTMNYFKGIDDLCCVSIALFEDESPIFGVVNRFYCKELYVGVVGKGAWINEAPIKASEVKLLSKSVFATGFPNGMDMSGDSLTDFTRRVSCVKKVRMLGSAALMAAFVATGKIDAYFEQDIRLWDIAGAMAIVKAAGGAVRLDTIKSDFKCDFGAFATTELMEEFYGS